MERFARGDGISIHTCADQSAVTRVVTLRSVPVVVFGVALWKEWASPWLLSTDQISEMRMTFLRHSREVFEELVSDYPFPMFNLVYIHNRLHLRWLKWLGFEIGEPEPHGPHDLLFHPVFKYPDV